MKKYNLINNTLGWLIFVVAAITYLLTIEPTASFWDCPEFIAQGFKSEIGHPPGNPIFILASRFAANFAGGDVTAVAKCVNAMSAIFSALTILLLFWSITHLVKKLLVVEGKEDSISLARYLVIMGSGVAGALAYTWSDTFWFSAVEAEVYAFSSFCTALVFWLILKWENRADEPDSDRWIILIAYVIGVSLGVHLLNLLCIPAIALVFYYRKFSNATAKGSLLTILISFVIIVLVLYGLEPGFVEMGQYFDLFFVNTLGMSFNSGVIFYVVLLLAALAWNIWELYSGKSDTRIKVSFAVAIALSGILLLGENRLIPLVLIIALLVYLFKFCNRVPKRVFTNISLSILVIFIGFGCYGLILIRSNAHTPLDENSPSNTFALAKYLSREQYGETPLLYGRTYKSDIMRKADKNGVWSPAVDEGRMQYAEEVKTDPSQPDHYKELGPKQTYLFSPEQNMVFPRIHDEKHASEYEQWLGLVGEQVQATTRLDENGNPAGSEWKTKPTIAENLRFFFDYQVNYMYWRYFMWNFAGRQNDLQGMGEITQGNWISGIPFIDNPRLGNQSLLPDDLGKGNKGHNVFYMLPLLLGIIGLLWQAFCGKKGIEQFWVVAFLFLMTGLAIVVYLNQTPSQPRERDYAYAGSFYAYAIWIGMGVAGLWRGVMALINYKKNKAAKPQEASAIEDGNSHGVGLAVAAVAALIGLLVPLQMVSQTWDDHDRSGRYTARDFGMNYLSGVAKNGIVFCNGDNDTFPLWYCQEVEGYRTDVRVVNLSYLATDWYISQMQRAAYDSQPLPMQAGPTTYAYDLRQFCYIIDPDTTRVTAIESLKHLYSDQSMNQLFGMYEIKYPLVTMPVDAQQAIASGAVPATERDHVVDAINLNLRNQGNGMTASQLMAFDLIATSISQGWKRPCYFAMTVPESYYLGLSPYLRQTGMTYEVTPVVSPDQSQRGEIKCNTDEMYNNVMTKFKWGGLDVAKPGSLYLDETVRRMVTTVRTSMIDLATDLISEGAQGLGAARFEKARKVLDMMETKLPVSVCPYSVQVGQQLANAYHYLATYGKDTTALQKAEQVLKAEILRYADYVRFYQQLSPTNYGRLNRIDLFIDQQYFSQLMANYNDWFAQSYPALENQVKAKGVNLERVNQILMMLQQQRQQEEEVRRQQAAAQAAVQTLGGEDNMNL